MRGYKTNFKLLEEENVLVETSHIYVHKSFPFMIFAKFFAIAIAIGLFIGAFLLLNTAFHSSNFNRVFFCNGRSFINHGNNANSFIF